MMRHFWFEDNTLVSASMSPSCAFKLFHRVCEHLGAAEAEGQLPNQAFVAFSYALKQHARDGRGVGELSSDDHVLSTDVKFKLSPAFGRGLVEALMAGSSGEVERFLTDLAEICRAA
jgi:hypothetical protein